MALLGLCKGDEVVDTLRDVFGCNIVRVPEERYRPVTVLASKGEKVTFRGDLISLLAGGLVGPLPGNLISKSRMADLSGKKSRSVGIDLGLDILDGFLKGMGIPSAGIKLKLERALTVSFAFEDVWRIWADTNLLGQALTGARIDRANPAASIFFNHHDYRFLLLDSVITSSSFTINVDKGSGSGFSLDVPGVQAIVANASVGVKVETTSGLELHFRGERGLAFAFSCIEFRLDQEGRVTALLPATMGRVLSRGMESLGSGTDAGTKTPERYLISDHPAMIEVE